MPKVRSKMGRPKLTRVERQERISFVVKRVKAGLSRCEIHKQLVDKYDFSYGSAKRWVTEALNTLTLSDSPEVRKQNKASILEMYHEQLVASQSDLMALQQEIDKIDKLIRTRETLTELAQNGDRTAEIKLEFIPEVPLTTKAQFLTMKSKMRSEMFKIMTEIGKIQGAYMPDTPWLSAINILLDNELITSEMASQILAQLEKINNPPLKQIEQVKEP